MAISNDAGSSVVRPDAVGLVSELIGAGITKSASDLHLDPGADGLKVRYRMDGVLNTLDHIPRTIAENVLSRVKVLGGLLTYRTDIPQEGSFTFEGATGAKFDLRVATFPTIHGERAVVRFFDDQNQASTIDQLGLSKRIANALKEASRQTSGLILVTGPAGAGKSTTLYALARHMLLHTPGRSVVSLEDPVEQRVEGLTQIQVQPFGELNYARAMRSLLRQDVEVLLVGEIRDAETAHIVIEAALTGHLILSTLHSGDPAETIARLMEMGVASYQLTSTIRLIQSQRLIRKTCNACSGGGCEACAFTGFKGRTVCAQCVSLDDDLRQAVLERAPTRRLAKLINHNQPSLQQCALELVESKQTSLGEVRRALGTDDFSQENATRLL